MDIIIRNANLVNEGTVTIADVLVRNQRIEKIAPVITMEGRFSEINAEGLFLLPGIIDGHVHFREPGLTWKGTIRSESKAAVAGGITSFMDMPNTRPATLTQELLRQKYESAAGKSWCNYSFFMGISKHNIEEALKTDAETVCGISDDGLYFDDNQGILANNPEFLEDLFSRTGNLIALHSENDFIIRENLEKFKNIFGEDIPAAYHPLIRTSKSCFKSTSELLHLAAKHGPRLHLLHISTFGEALLLTPGPTADKRTTAEACVHHLYFSDHDYIRLGSRIKWNPAVKSARDREGLMASLLEDRLDMIATDHAPHLLHEKSGSYTHSLPGGPLVQHSLPVMLELCLEGRLTLEKVVEKMSHNVAEVYRIRERGYIREGYYADLVLADLNSPWTVDCKSLLYKCRWSPFEGTTFQSRIIITMVNGLVAYDRGRFRGHPEGRRLLFSKHR